MKRLVQAFEFNRSSKGVLEPMVLRSSLMVLGLPRMRFHDLRATWANILLGKGVPAYKVMTAGWQDLKTVHSYLRKSGVDIKGITKDLVF